MEPTQKLTHQQQAIAWRRKFLFPMPGDTDYKEMLDSAIWFQLSLISEEYFEMRQEVINVAGEGAESRADLLKEMADVVFTVFQMSALLDMDLSTALDRIYESNMTKVNDDGNPVFNENGKAMKTENYVKPDLTGLY